MDRYQIQHVESRNQLQTLFPGYRELGNPESGRHRIITDEIVTCSAVWFIQRVHILWYVVIVLHGAPGQHLAGLSGLLTDSCHLPLKHKHKFITNTRHKTLNTILIFRAVAKRRTAGRLLSSPYLKLASPASESKCWSSSFLYLVTILTQILTPRHQLCRYRFLKQVIARSASISDRSLEPSSLFTCWLVHEHRDSAAPLKRQRPVGVNLIGLRQTDLKLWLTLVLLKLMLAPKGSKGRKLTQRQYMNVAALLIPPCYVWTY